MEKRTISIKIKNKIITVKIFSFLDRATFLRGKGTFINKIIEDIEKNSESEGFAGFKDKNGFRCHINSNLYRGKLRIEKYPVGKIQLNKCTELARETLIKIYELLEQREIHLYLFPTNSKFTIDMMNGSSGRWIWKNIIYIDLFPVKNWEMYFKSSFAHEIAHLLQKNYSYDISIGEGLIFEGMAEHFQETFLGEVKNQWTTALSKEKAKEIFKEIKSIIRKKDFSLYNQVFFGTGKYPLWTGYSIGYYIIKEYLEKHNLSWREIFMKEPEEILREIKW